MTDFLTVKKLSYYLNMHPQSIYKLVKNLEIPFIRKLGVGIRFDKREIDEWLRQGSAKFQSFLDSHSKVDLALEKYDKLFLKGERVSHKGKTWTYPFGSVYFRLTKSGKERWYIYYRVDGRRIRKVVKNAQSRVEALKVLHTEVADAFRHNYGFKREEKKIKFDEFADLYLENYAKVNKKSWKDDSYCVEIFKHYFKGTFLHEISSFDIEKFKTERLKKGNSKSRVNRYLALIKKMFHLAVDWEYLQENPAKKVKLFSEKDNQKERILNHKEEKKLIEASAEHLKPILITALNTGMRKGEILNLKWNQIDLARRIIRVEKTKNDEARILPINQALLKELIQLKRENGKSDYVFSNPMTGKPIKNVKTAFNAAKRRSGIENLRFHDLRHTFASRLVEKGVDIITVKNLLGHHSVVITQRYTHSGTQQKMNAVDKLGHKTEDHQPLFVHTMSTQKDREIPNAFFANN